MSLDVITAFYTVDFWVKEAAQLHYQTLVIGVEKQNVWNRERGYPDESAEQVHQHDSSRHELEFSRDVQEENVMCFLK